VRRKYLLLLLAPLVIVLTGCIDIPDIRVPTQRQGKGKIVSQTYYSRYSHQGTSDFGYIVEAKVINTGFRGPIKIGATLWTRTGKWTKYRTIYLRRRESQTVRIPFFEPSLWQKAWYSVWIEPRIY